jgi:class 3 adenylate cyclase
MDRVIWSSKDMGLIELLKKIRDIGVPEDMPLEESRYVHFLNTVILIFCLLIVLYGYFALRIGMTVILISVLIFIPFIVLCVYLNMTGRHQLARVLLVLLGLIFQLTCTVFYDAKGSLGYYAFLAYGILTILLFPKKESSTMYVLAALNPVFIAAALVLKDRFEPLYPLNESDLAHQNNIELMLIYVVVMTLSLVSRSFIVESEDMMRKEHEIARRLSEKLKVYLPRQFVNSLSNGERETMPDYRRKRLTIFFSDVQGFTKWTDKLEPEEVREILNHYLSEMSAIAGKWGGTIDKFIGDCLMIFFGDPEFTNDKDHAVRCVKMAMEMQAKMAELRAGWRKMAYEESLNIRIGINTGWATVGNFGSEDRLNYTALGSAVNLASRIESACAPDKISVSSTTYLLIEDEIECEPKGTIEAKGFSEPVKIYEVVGLKARTESASD